MPEQALQSLQGLQRAGPVPTAAQTLLLALRRGMGVLSALVALAGAAQAPALALVPLASADQQGHSTLAVPLVGAARPLASKHSSGQQLIQPPCYADSEVVLGEVTFSAPQL